MRCIQSTLLTTLCLAAWASAEQTTTPPGEYRVYRLTLEKAGLPVQLAVRGSKAAHAFSPTRGRFSFDVAELRVSPTLLAGRLRSRSEGTAKRSDSGADIFL